MCQDTRITGICDVVLDSTRRGRKNIQGKMPTRRLLKDLALTDLPMPYKQPVLYFSTRPAAALFFPIAAGLLFVWF